MQENDWFLRQIEYKYVMMIFTKIKDMFQVLIVVWLYLVCWGILLSFLFYFKQKLDRLERLIVHLFYHRTNLVPALFEETLPYISKHEEVFDEIIRLRKHEFSLINSSFVEIIENEKLIHHELNFIFKIANKHPKLEKNGKFLLIRDLFLENSELLGSKVLLYKHMLPRYHWYLRLKNATLIGFFLSFQEKKEI